MYMYIYSIYIGNIRIDIDIFTLCVDISISILILPIYILYIYIYIYVYIYIYKHVYIYSIVRGTELEDVRIDSDEKSDIEKSIVNVGMIGQLIPSRIISSSEEMIISADNINACRTEGHGDIDHGVDEDHLGEEIISNNQQSFNSREKQSKNVSLSQQDTSLVDILASLLQDENTVQALSPSVVTSTAGNVSTHGNRTSCFKTEQKAPPANSERMKGYFCSDTVFNLSNKVLSQTEISVLEKGLGLVPTPNMINEADLRRDFNEFSRKMRCKWYFRDEPSEEFSEIPAFKPKSTWKPPAGDPCVELFLSKMEHELFSFLPGKPQSYNLTKEEWQALKNLKEDRSIIIKPADSGIVKITLQKVINSSMMNLFMLILSILLIRHYLISLRKVTNFLNG